MVTILLACLLVPLMALVVVLEVWSLPGRPRAFTDASGEVLPNSLAKKEWV
jgi:hypothetical protein